MKKYILIITMIIGLFQQSFALGIDIHGYVRNYLGALTEQDGEYSVTQNTLDLEFSHSAKNSAFFINPYVNHDKEGELKLDLREAYVDLMWDNADLRVGKQQIIWGKADGVFITDIISPKNLSEFLLPDFEEIRIGVNAVKFDYYLGDQTFELVWLPEFQPTIFAEQGSIWAPKMPNPAEMMSLPMVPPITYDYSKSEVQGSLENSELAGKYSFLSSTIDFELMGAYLWDDNPSIHLLKQMDPNTHQLTGITVRPEYHRLTMGGGSFGVTLAGVVIRGEGAYYTGRNYTAMDNPAEGKTYEEGVVEKDYAHYLLGFDYNVWGVDISGQYIQERILDYEEEMVQDEVQNTATFLMAKDYLNETLMLELFTYYGFDNEDGLIRPKLTYDIADGFELLIGANIFIGEGVGMFGMYEKNDMVYTKLKYSF
ncbi:MAG: DUF1302 family protein [Calditrichaceae bacterium]